MNVGEACDVNTVLSALTNEKDSASWDAMEKAGRRLAERAHKVLSSGHDAASFSRALAVGQGFQKSQRPRKPRRPAPL